MRAGQAGRRLETVQWTASSLTEKRIRHSVIMVVMVVMAVAAVMMMVMVVMVVLYFLNPRLLLGG